MYDPLAIHFVMAILSLWPLVRLMRRAGLASWWSALILVPMIGPALVASVLVFKRWPTSPPAPVPARRRRR